MVTSISVDNIFKKQRLFYVNCSIYNVSVYVFYLTVMINDFVELTMFQQERSDKKPTKGTLHFSDL